MTTNQHNVNRQKLLNSILYIILAFQFVLLISGAMQYDVQIHLHVLFYPAAFLLIYFYLLIGYTKESGIQWEANRLKLMKDDEPDLSAGRTIYNLQKWITLILALIFSVLAAIFAFINIFEQWAVFYQYILSFTAVSSLLILVLMTVSGIRHIIILIKKPWKKQSLLFRMLLLQNLLISTAVLKLLANIQG